jgi:hypothetical protein
MSNKRCFITAPYGLNLSALQRALEEHGVDWEWAKQPTAGTSLIESISKAIRNADFLLAVSSDSGLSPNSFLEIGYALGSEIPVVLLTTESLEAPIDLATLRHLKTDLKDSKLLSFQVQLLLSSLEQPKGKRVSVKSSTLRQTKSRKLSPQEYASSLEEAVATAVIKAGGRVTLPERGSKGQARADFLMWFPEIDKEFFNPAAIEVKTKIDLANIADTHARFGQFVMSSGFGCGLIVSGAEIPSKQLPQLAPFPNVFIISRDNFEDALHSHTLGVWVRYERNRIVHGVR